MLMMKIGLSIPAVCLLLGAMGSRPALGASTPDRQLATRITVGTVSAVNAREWKLWVKDKKGTVTEFKVAYSTQIKRGNTAVKLGDIVVGEQVTVKYEKRGDRVWVKYVLLQAGKPGPRK